MPQFIQKSPYNESKNHTKPRKMSHALSGALDYYRRGLPDDALILAVYNLDNYRELAYFAHILSNKRNITKQKRKYKDVLKAIQLKRAIMRNNKQLAAIYDRYIIWRIDQ